MEGEGAESEGSKCVLISCYSSGSTNLFTSKTLRQNLIPLKDDTRSDKVSAVPSNLRGYFLLTTCEIQRIVDSRGCYL